MGERRDAKRAWDDKIKNHRGSTTEAEYLRVTGGYDKPLPGSRNVIGPEGKPSFFNGRKRRSVSAIAIAAVLGTGYGQLAETSLEVSNTAPVAVASVGKAAVHAFEATDGPLQISLETMASDLL